MSIRIIFPPPHESQKIFYNWSTDYPQAQCLIAPSGTKAGKSFGSSAWLAKEMLTYENLFGVWLAPTYFKSKVGYRYIKAMLPDIPEIECLDGKLEIRFGNRSFLKFLHSKDAESTVEGEAIDRFVIDESGKLPKQVWYSLFTTITQTQGKGIVTGTPRGFNWYYDEFRKAKAGDPFYVWAQLKTECSPYVQAEAIAQAKRLLPKALFDQYYNAMFVSMSSVFGDIGKMFDESIKVDRGAHFWIHPNAELRKQDTVTGWDIAKQRDYSVFYTTTFEGQLVGYARFRRVDYMSQVARLKTYLHKFFHGDRMLRYDATGVGSAVGDMLIDQDIDASITAVTFSQRSKQEMVSRLTMAIESGWHQAPRIEQLEHEFGSYELSVSKSGLFTYSAPDGEHDDIVSAAMLSVSEAYNQHYAMASDALIEKFMTGDYKADENTDDDIIERGIGGFYEDEDGDDFFNEGGYDSDFDIDAALGA